MSLVFSDTPDMKKILDKTVTVHPLWLRLNYHTKEIVGHRWQWFSHRMDIGHLGQLKKNKIMWAFLELPAKQSSQFGQFGPFF